MMDSSKGEKVLNTSTVTVVAHEERRGDLGGMYDHIGGCAPIFCGLGGCLRHCLNCILFPAPTRSVAELTRVERKWKPEMVQTCLGDNIAVILHTHAESVVTLLVCHGNAEDITESVKDMRRLSRYLKVNICQFEYPGYSLSSGKPSEYRIYAAADAAFEYLVKDKNIRMNSIVIFGRSIGSGPAVDLASRRSNLGGLILQSPLTSAVGTIVPDCVALSCFCLCLPCCDTFRNIRKIDRVTCPTFFIHGTNDKVVPLRNVLALLSRSQNPAIPLLIPGAGHNDIEVLLGKRYVLALKDFLQGLQRPKKSKLVEKKSGSNSPRSNKRRSQIIPTKDLEIYAADEKKSKTAFLDSMSSGDEYGAVMSGDDMGTET